MRRQLDRQSPLSSSSSHDKPTALGRHAGHDKPSQGKAEGKRPVQYSVHESDSWPEALYNLGSGSWLAWANDTAAHYAAIVCPR